MRKVLKRSLCILMSLLLSLGLANMINSAEKVYAYGMTAAATNDYTTWKQTSSSWGEAEPWPNASIPKFGDAGCWITSVAILLRHYNVVTDSNVNTFNPLICNNHLMQYGIVNSAGDFCNLGNIKNAYPGFEYVGQEVYSLSNLKNLYDQGYACIVHETRGHYVAVRSVSSSSAVVMDPGYSTTSLTNSDTIQYFKITAKPQPTLTINLSTDQNISGASFPITGTLKNAGKYPYLNLYVDYEYVTTTCNNEYGDYAFYLDTTKYSDGYHRIGVKMVNEETGLDYTEWRDIIINNTGLDFSIHLVDGDVLSGNSKYIAGQVFNGGKYPWLELYMDYEYVSYTCNNEYGIYAFYLDTTKYENGEHKLAVKMRNEDGYDYTIWKNVIIQNTKPDITNVSIVEDENGYTISCTVVDLDSGVNRVQFPTWTEKNDRDDIDTDWFTSERSTGVKNGDTYTFRVNKTDHNNECGVYYTHIWAYNNYGLGSCLGCTIELSHSWDIGTIVQKADCAKIGITRFTCKYCGEKKDQNIEATGHQHTELRNVKSATCSEAGYTGDTYCKDCETQLSTGEVIAKKAHTWDEGVVTKEATCTEKGVKTYTCTGCKITKIEDVVATSHQHTELRNVKAATCSETGYTGDVYCKDCETKLSTGETISKKTHIWNEGVVTKEATCTEKGVRTYTCTGCNTTKTEDIATTGHQHTELRNVKDATCSEAGYTGDTYCKDCDSKLSSGEETAKKAHTWDEGVVTKAASCTEKGVKTYSCTGCKTTKTDEITATGHENKVTKFAKEASCKVDGYTGDIYCQDCGKLLEEGILISKTEHTWNTGKVTKAATCTDEGIKTLTCTSCGTTKTETVSATGHGVTEVRNKKNANCVTEGYTGDTYCTICNQKISSGVVVAKTGHSWDEGKVTKQPTTTETGIRTYTCRNCGSTKTETISKLKPQTATPGKIIKDKSTNGIYKVLKGGLSVEFTKPVSKKASVRIPDTVKVDGITCKVTGISTNAFKNNSSLKTVTIGKNVTVIGANAFYGCKKLSKVSGGNSIVKIGDRAFANCISLSSVTIAGTVKSIGKQAFYNCKKLRTIIIKTSALSSKTIGAKAFTGTYSKPTVRVPAKKLNAYKKLLKSKGMSGKAVYKK